MSNEVMGTEGSVPVSAEGTPASRRLQAQPVKVLSYELARLRQALPILVRRAMSFSALPCFDNALVAAVNDFYGMEMDVATAETEILEDPDERIRFFPWFLWDWREAPGSDTVGDRFAQEASHSAYDKRLITGLRTSYVGFYEALDDATLQGVHLRDMVTGEVMLLSDEGLTGELFAGQILQARLVRIPDFPGNYVSTDSGHVVLIDAVYAVLPAAANGSIQREIDALPDGLSGVSTMMKSYTAEFLELGEYLMEMLAKPPVPLNSDGELLVLCQSSIRGADAERVFEGMAARPDEFHVVEQGLWMWKDNDRCGGFIQRAEDSRCILGATGPKRLTSLQTQIAKLASVQTPPLASYTEFNQAAATWVGNGSGQPWTKAMPEVALALRDWLSVWGRGCLYGPYVERHEADAVQPVASEDAKRRVEAILGRLHELQLEQPAMFKDLKLDALRVELGLA